MGHKVNPKLFRLGPLYNWDSRWFDEKKYKETLLEDYKLRKAITERLKQAGGSLVEIERSINSLKITAYVSKPGMVIGRGGAGLEELKKFINEIILKGNKGKNLPKIDIRVEPIKEPNLDAFLVAGGAEIARREKMQEGTVPLSTIREHVSYASVPALTKKGYIGVKVWINKKEE
ncbi:MAG: KH domain-containing protein [Candidatus Levybacteria bacterium]|nr:KH domain-containing protein [Candidatus Levybacteria bacterium]